MYDTDIDFRIRQVSLATGVVLLWLLLSSASVLMAQNGARNYRIGPRDKIAIRVLEDKTFDVQAEVDDTGAVEIPVLGSVRAQGLTEDELARQLQQTLESDYLQQATVSVRLMEFRISVLGSVNKPGSISVPGGTTLLEVLLRAGDLSSKHGDTIIVRRRASNGLSDQLSIRIEDLIDRADPAVNLPILAGDLINIPPALEITVTVLGEVETTGSLNFSGREKATLLTAIARAGGLTESASKIIRIRRGRTGQEEELTVDFRRIFNGKASDVELLNGDIIFVKESFF